MKRFLLKSILITLLPLIVSCGNSFSVAGNDLTGVATWQTACGTEGTERVILKFEGSKMVVQNTEYYFKGCNNPYFTVKHTYDVSVGDTLYEATGASGLGITGERFDVKKLDLTVRGLSFLYNAPPSTPTTSKTAPTTTCTPLSDDMGGTSFSTKDNVEVNVMGLTKITEDDAATGYANKCDFAFGDYFDYESATPSSWINFPSSITFPSFGYLDSDTKKPRKLNDGLVEYGVIGVLKNDKDQKYLFLSASMAKTEAERPFTLNTTLVYAGI